MPSKKSQHISHRGKQMLRMLRKEGGNTCVCGKWGKQEIRNAKQKIQHVLPGVKNRLDACGGMKEKARVSGK